MLFIIHLKEHGFEGKLDKLKSRGSYNGFMIICNMYITRSVLVCLHCNRFKNGRSYNLLEKVMQRDIHLVFFLSHLVLIVIMHVCEIDDMINININFLSSTHNITL